VIQLEMSDDGLLALAKLLSTLTQSNVGDRLTSSAEYRAYFEAREDIDRAAEEIIHAERSTRRPVTCPVHGEPACVVCIAESARRHGVRIEATARRFAVPPLARPGLPHSACYVHDRPACVECYDYAHRPAVVTL
jgi:hypothetical protein